MFNSMGIKENTLGSLHKMGFIEPTPIQRMSIPLILGGNDVMAQAQTGTGKTGAFAIPTLNQIRLESKIQVLVLTPTRELSQQVGTEFQKIGQVDGLKVACVVGGKSYRDQIRDIQKAQVLVATPGRLKDLLDQGAIKNLDLKVVILDEADRMLDMGFADDMEDIFEYLPTQRQTLLFSATFPRSVQKLAQSILRPGYDFVKAPSTSETNTDIRQEYYVVTPPQKDMALERILHYLDPSKAIIFCEMKRDVDRVGDSLKKLGFDALVLHGDTQQKDREMILRNFKSRKRAILVATDLAGRGLDVPDITHVINYSIPYNMDSYVHRVGRTGRAGKSGVAINLVSRSEIKTIERWQRNLKTKIELKDVPTLSDLRRQWIQKLDQKIKEFSIEPAVLGIVGELSESHPIETVAGFFIQQYMDNRFLSGPENLGMSKKDLSPEVISRKHQAINQGITRRRSSGARSGARFASGGGRSSERSEASGRSSDRPRSGGRPSGRSQSGRYSSEGSSTGGRYSSERSSGSRNFKRSRH